MHRVITVLLLLLATTYASESPGQYSFHINWVFVTPESLKKTQVPFQFDVVERDAGLFSLSLVLPAPSKDFGTVAKCEVLVSTLLLPAEGEVVFADVNASVAEKNRKRTIEVSVPSETQESVSRNWMLSKAEIEHALIRVHFHRHGYVETFIGCCCVASCRRRLTSRNEKS